MELILYIALGIVLGVFLLAFLDKVLVVVLGCVAVVVGFVILLIAVSAFDSMSSKDAQELGGLLLVLLGLAVIWDALRFLRYSYRVAIAKKRKEAPLQRVSGGGDVSGVDDDKREVAHSPYASNRFVLRRETRGTWVTIDGSDYQEDLKDALRFGIAAYLFFRKRHRIVENQSFEEFLLRRAAKSQSSGGGLRSNRVP